MDVKGGWDDLRAAFAYLPPVDRLVMDFKFSHMPHLAPDLADAMETAARKWFDTVGVDALVPVPLHTSRIEQRGYNQSELLAAELAQRIDRPFLPNAIIRTRDTEHQSRLSREERHRNVKGAFEADPRWVRGRVVVLVDDVSTTGSTISECALALKSAGAHKVLALIAARALRD